MPGPYRVAWRFSLAITTRAGRAEDGKVGDAGEVRGRHVCRPYMGDLAGVRGNKSNVQRRVKPPPSNMED